MAADGGCVLAPAAAESKIEPMTKVRRARLHTPCPMLPRDIQGTSTRTLYLSVLAEPHRSSCPVLDSSMQLDLLWDTNYGSLTLWFHTSACFCLFRGTCFLLCPSSLIASRKRGVWMTMITAAVSPDHTLFELLGPAVVSFRRAELASRERGLPRSQGCPWWRRVSLLTPG